MIVATAHLRPGDVIEQALPPYSTAEIDIEDDICGDRPELRGETVIGVESRYFDSRLTYVNTESYSCFSHPARSMVRITRPSRHPGEFV